MMLAAWKRTLLAGLVTLSVATGALATVTTAAANEKPHRPCYDHVTIGSPCQLN